MKVLLYDLDKGGIKKYSEYLVQALKKMNFNIILSDKLNYKDFDIVHIQFEHSIFHPFGLRLIPLLIGLRLKKKKVLITTHTVLSRKEIYARNNFFVIIKKILLPLNEILMSKLCDKMIVHTDYAKRILIKDYNIPPKKIGVIRYGVYQ